MINDDCKDMFFVSDDQNNTSTPRSEKKSILGNIKISFFRTNTLKTNSPDIHPYSDDEQISNFMDSLTSLIYDNSKSKSLETIGKTIEPQINFYFEFWIYISQLAGKKYSSIIFIKLLDMQNIFNYYPTQRICFYSRKIFHATCCLFSNN
jgi:hypothetical protein